MQSIIDTLGRVIEFFRPFAEWLRMLTLEEKFMLGLSLAVAILFLYFLIKDVFFEFVRRFIKLLFSPWDKWRESAKYKKQLKIQYKFAKKMAAKEKKREDKKIMKAEKAEQKRLEKNSVVSVKNKTLIRWVNSYKKIGTFGPSNFGKTLFAKMGVLFTIMYFRDQDLRNYKKELLLGRKGRMSQRKALNEKGFFELYSDDEIELDGLKSQPLSPILYQKKRPTIVRPVYFADDAQRFYPKDFHMLPRTPDLEALEDSGIRDRHNNDATWWATSTDKNDLWVRLRNTGWLSLEVRQKIKIYILEKGKRKIKRRERFWKIVPGWFSGNILLSFQMNLTIWLKIWQFFKNFAPITVGQKELYEIKKEGYVSKINSEYKRFSVEVWEVIGKAEVKHLFVWSEDQMIYLPDRHIQKDYDKKFDKEGNRAW